MNQDGARLQIRAEHVPRRMLGDAPIDGTGATTELAAADGMGIIGSGTGEPVTFAGMVPAVAHDL